MSAEVNEATTNRLAIQEGTCNPAALPSAAGDQCLSPRKSLAKRRSGRSTGRASARPRLWGEEINHAPDVYTTSTDGCRANPADSQ
jgi:hypothetical protein